MIQDDYVDTIAEGNLVPYVTKSSANLGSNMWDKSSPLI